MAMASTCSGAVSTLDRAFIYSLILRHQARTLTRTRLRAQGPPWILPPQGLGLQLTPRKGAFSTSITPNFEPTVASAHRNNSLSQIHHRNHRPALHSTRPHRNVALQRHTQHAYSTAAAALNDLDLAPHPSRPSDAIANASSPQGWNTGQAAPEVVLSAEQQFLMEQVIKKKRSIFFTGSAGTGKSVLLRQLIEELKESYRPGNVAVTASTGIAACNIGGCTLHSFAGVGLGNGTVEQLMVKLDANKEARKRWRKAKVLIIDEISMIDGELFDKLEEIARRVKKSNKPFGGIQLILTGDFFQLPPVVKETVVKPNPAEASTVVSPGQLSRPQTSRTTTTIIKNPSASDFDLATSFDDVLNEPLLADTPTPEPPKQATLCFDSQSWSKCIHHTLQLTEVFRQRDPQFIKMLTEVRHGELSPETCEMFKKLERAPEYPDDGIQATELYALRYQVDRSNHRQLDALPGDSYVYEPQDSGPMAEWMHKFSPAPSKLQLKVDAQVMLIKNLSPTLVNGSMGIVMGFQEDTTMDEASGQWVSSYFPVVRFVGEEDDLVIRPEEWRMEQPDGEVIGSRVQVPLILAWAMSIHKSQGQTMDRVKVDMGKIFEAGQGYVALSRATSLAGLQVLNFNEKAVQTNARVAEFYDTLGTVQDLMEQVNASKTKTRKRKTKKAEAVEQIAAAPEVAQVPVASEVVAPAAVTTANTMAKAMASAAAKTTRASSNNVLKELTASKPAFAPALSPFSEDIWHEVKGKNARPNSWAGDLNPAMKTSDKSTALEDAEQKAAPTRLKVPSGSLDPLLHKMNTGCFSTTEIIRLPSEESKAAVSKSNEDQQTKATTLIPPATATSPNVAAPLSTTPSKKVSGAKNSPLSLLEGNARATSLVSDHLKTAAVDSSKETFNMFPKVNRPAWKKAANGTSGARDSPTKTFMPATPEVRDPTSVARAESWEPNYGYSPKRAAPKGTSSAPKDSRSTQLPSDSLPYDPLPSGKPTPKVFHPRFGESYVPPKANDPKPREYPPTNSFAPASKASKVYDKPASRFAPRTYDGMPKARDQTSSRAYSPTPKKEQSYTPPREWIPYTPKPVTSDKKLTPSTLTGRW